MESYLVYTHGVSKKSKVGFSKMFQEEIGEGLEYVWSQHFDPYQEKVMEEYQKEKGVISDLMAYGHIMTISDAILYPMMKNNIMLELHEKLKKVDKPLTFITHSMGTVIALDYIMKFKPRVKAMYACGTNLGLFYHQPLRLPEFEYHCFNEKNDFLGWSNKELFPFPIGVHKHKDWSFWRGWNWASHLGYFKSRKLARKIKELMNEN